MERAIEWAVVILAFATILTFAVYAGAAFLLWDATPFPLAVSRGVFLCGLVSAILTALGVECERSQKGKGK